MPELPEVETVKRTLQELVIGKTIKDVEVRWANIIKKPVDVQQFTFLVQNQKINDVRRRGKFLLFYLDDYVLVSHLRMEGKYGLHHDGEQFDKHTHVIFYFSDKTQLWYRDVRKFGTMYLFSKGEEFSQPPLLQLGPEPLTDEFLLGNFRKKLKSTERNIKAVLLDQTVVAGLGNIYVDEALFRSGIHPNRKANSLKQKEVELLRECIIETLSEAVDKGGSTVRSYVNSQGQIGMFQLQLFVYGRKGEDCRKCGSLIEKTVVAGRGTHYCPNCQPTRYKGKIKKWN